MAKHIPHLFFTENELIQKKLSDENFNHLIKVIRLKEKDTFYGLDNNGNKYICFISDIQKHFAGFDISEKFYYPKPDLNLVLVQSITKFESFEEVLDKVTQLGISEIIPLLTENTTVSKDLFFKKLPRFQKIIKTASEQSKRIYMPGFTALITLDEFIKNNSPENIIIAYENSRISMKEYFRNYKYKEKIYLVCGPEGGFSDKEVKLLDEKNYSLTRLCSPVLRSETASIVGIGNIIYELESI